MPGAEKDNRPGAIYREGLSGMAESLHVPINEAARIAMMQALVSHGEGEIPPILRALNELQAEQSG